MVRLLGCGAAFNGARCGDVARNIIQRCDACGPIESSTFRADAVSPQSPAPVVEVQRTAVCAMRPGLKTTEFWVAFVMVTVALSVAYDAQRIEGLLIAALVSVGYSGARAWAKR